MANILVIDPSRSMRNTLKERLEYEGHAVEVAEDTISGMTVYANRHFDLLLCGQPDSPLRTSTPWIRLSHDSSPESAVLAMQQGAVDFVTKPINMNRLLDAVRKGLAKTPAAVADAADEAESVPEEVVPVRRVRAARSHVGRIVGESVPVKRLNTLIDKVAPTDARVLIMGANGTGKELVARWLHEKSRRRDGPFVEVNCAAIPSELIESELFGHEKGAFTSAVKQRKGKFEQAHNGTLFLDEIGDMSLPAQAKVLRVLQEQEFERLGGMETRKVDVRVVAATSRNLEQMVKDGLFRRDLYYRLNVFPVSMPPLRERQGDIPLLVENFLEKYGHKIGKRGLRVAPEAEALLLAHSWPGNIRELENVIERAVILTTDGLIRPDLLPPAMQAPCALCSLRGTLPDALEQLERQLITEALQEHRGNMGHAAQALGISERVMGLRMRKFGLGYKAFRRGAP